jgi:hypothetical protein
MLERGRQRGELAGDADLDVLIDVILGPFAYRRLLSHAPIDAALVERVLAVVLPDVCGQSSDEQRAAASS